MRGKCPCDSFWGSPKGWDICICSHIFSEHRQKGLSQYAIFGECEHLLKSGEYGYVQNRETSADKRGNDD
jgi:hypothetical protein